MQKLCRENERVDDLQNGFFLLQNPSMFCFGIDAVLLSAFCQVHPRERCLDLGTGNGILPILLCAKTRGKDFVGLEINPRSVSLARRSVEGNHLEEKIRIEEGDLREAKGLFGSSSFDVVVTNPPYMPGEGGKKSGDYDKALARHELACTLEDVARSAAEVLKEKGRLYMVHRPQRLSEILVTLSRHRLETKQLRLVYPFWDKAPNLVLIEAKLGAGSGMNVLPPLIVYEKPGVYTPEVLSMYGKEVS